MCWCYFGSITVDYERELAQDAAAALEELLDHLVRVLGEDHPDTLTTRHNLAHRQEKAKEAGVHQSTD